MKLLTFNEALSKTDGEDRSLLMGNGFSIAFDPKIFSYNSLKEQSKNLSPKIHEVFKALNTVDFEEVIEAFRLASVVCNVHEMKNDFLNVSDEIRNVLIETIAISHPDFPDKITQSQFSSCISFLSNFNKKIYTLNYDMLLYWVLMRDMFREGREKKKIKKLQDGFAYNDEDFLNWDGSNFDIHYLHGALHLFEHSELEKLNYSRTQDSLKNQFVRLISENKKFPLFVAEGNSTQKLTKIRSSGYLTRCYNSLQKIGSPSKRSSFFTYGVSFSENDDHITQCLGRNKCSNFFIGLYGNPESEHNIKTIKNSKKIDDIRKQQKHKRKMNIEFFDAATANVWETVN